MGATQQFTATGTYSDGTTQNLTTQAVWASSDTNVAAISASGLATTADVRHDDDLRHAERGRPAAPSLTVQVGPLVITTSSLPGGTVDTAYSATLAATGGLPPYTWLVTSGALPDGLSLHRDLGGDLGYPDVGRTVHLHRPGAAAGSDHVSRASRSR